MNRRTPAHQPAVRLGCSRSFADDAGIFTGTVTRMVAAPSERMAGILSRLSREPRLRGDGRLEWSGRRLFGRSAPRARRHPRVPGERPGVSGPPKSRRPAASAQIRRELAALTVDRSDQRQSFTRRPITGASVSDSSHRNAESPIAAQSYRKLAYLMDLAGSRSRETNQRVPIPGIFCRREFSS
jgi:hypothetical protein